MTTAELLARVYHLFDSDAKWTRGTFARDKNNQTIGYNHPCAVRWCVLGAIYKEALAADMDGRPVITELAHTIDPSQPEVDREAVVFNCNDGWGRGTIRQKLRETVERLTPDEAPALLDEKVEERELVAVP